MNEGSIEWFIEVIKCLPSDPPVEKGCQGYNNYTTQKDHWLGWLDPDSKTGSFPRKRGPGRDAKYVYNHIGEPKMLLWLLSASEVSAELVQAATISAESAPSLAGKCAAIRKTVPWLELVPILSEGRSGAV